MLICVHQMYHREMTDAKAACCMKIIGKSHELFPELSQCAAGELFFDICFVEREREIERQI